MRKYSRFRILLLATSVAVVVIFAATVWLVGSALTRSFNHPVAEPPSNLKLEAVTFPSRSGTVIKAWFSRGTKGRGAVVLAHGIGADRTALLGRTRFLSEAGFSILLFDFRAHGESTGDQVTFGFLESRDVQAAVEYMKAAMPGERVGLIGQSMGGAAALLSNPSLEVDAMVLEAVYPDIERAVSNRISAQLGKWSANLAPLLTLQLKPRLGIRVDDLRPIDHVGALKMPKLFLAGEDDQYTTLDESKRLFEAASEPKELWTVPHAGHVDFHSVDGEVYKKRILNFLGSTLSLDAIESEPTN